jgi:hypothetical protein
MGAHFAMFTGYAFFLWPDSLHVVNDAVRLFGASVTCCRIEEISTSSLSLECRSLAAGLRTAGVYPPMVLSHIGLALTLPFVVSTDGVLTMKKFMLLGALALAVLAQPVYADEKPPRPQTAASSASTTTSAMPCAPR